MKHVQKVAISSTALVSLLLTGSVASAASLGEQAQAGGVQAQAQLTPLSSTSYTGGDTPSQIRHAYGFDQLSETGSGQTIALVEAYGSPTAANDLSVFDSQFGLPAANLTVAMPGGTPTTNGGWALQTAMDVEWAHAIAPSANLLLVEAKSSSITDLLTAVDYATSHGANVVSMTWGSSETATESTYETHFEHTGVAFVANAGDSSSAEWPAVSPNVLSVGANTLTLDANGNYLSETGDTSKASSAYFAIPTYQKNYAPLLGNDRVTPDVSIGNTSNGAAVYDSTSYSGESGWFQTGPGSAAAPEWAALVALADQQRAAKFSSSNLLADLYSLGGATNFHVGSKTLSTGTSSVPSGVLGSPIANVLVPNLITAP